MSRWGGSFATDAEDGNGSDEVTPQSPIVVFSCSRLGRGANPPSSSFIEWLRSARRR